MFHNLVSDDPPWYLLTGFDTQVEHRDLVIGGFSGCVGVLGGVSLSDSSSEDGGSDGF